MQKEKKTNLNLDMFHNVNSFNGIDRSNLIVEGDMDAYVPFVIKQLWFRMVYAKGNVETTLVSAMDDMARHKLCVFKAEVYDNENRMIGMGHGSASTDEDSFIEVAERRAIGKALASAGFTWHNGDFTIDMDMAKTFLNLYNGYINTGSLNIHDEKVTQMYDDALVTVLPEGYGTDTGKSIAAMDQKHMEDIAKNYGFIDSGDALVNAKIKFVYMYQMFQQEAAKKAEPETSFMAQEPVSVEQPEQAAGTDTQKKGKRGRKPKKTALPDADAADNNNPETVVDSKVGEEASETKNYFVEEETVPATPADTDAQPEKVDESMPEEQEIEPFDDSVYPEMEDVFSDEDMDAEEMAEIFAFVAENTASENVSTNEGIEDKAEDDSYMDNDGQEVPFAETTDTGSNEEERVFDDEFEGFTPDTTEENPFTEDDDFDIEGDLQKETHFHKVLLSWGYRSEDDLTGDGKWTEHLKKVREKCATLDWSDKEKAKEFVENIPIFNNFLWKERAEQGNVVLLGDFMNENKDDVLNVFMSGALPLTTLKKPIGWYIENVWDVF